MYAKRIIPCLDLKNGRVVKGTNFVNLRDAGDPVEAAVEYDRQGADELVLLDITASSDGYRFPRGEQYFYPVYGGRRHPYGRGFHGAAARGRG